MLDKRVAGNLLADTDPDFFAADGSEYKSRLYCIDCCKFIEAEVRYDTKDYPIVHHNDGRIHHVIFQTDIQLLLALVTPWRGQSALFEIAQMYGLSTQESRTGVRKCWRRSLDCRWKIPVRRMPGINCNSSPVTKTISSDVLIQLYNARFRKLVPLLPDSKKANVYDHLITEEEIKAFPSAEGKSVRIIYQNPTFWTETRLKEKSHLFNNVATTFGLTDMKDSKDSPLYLYGVDIDTREAYEALKELLETLKGITYVVKSHKEYGYHFYILTPHHHDAMGRTSFKQGAEIEIKTDLSLGTMHLPPSRHRKYPYWKYERVSTAEQIYIDEDDKVFQEIVKRMSPYLRKEPTEENMLTLDAYPSHSGGSTVSVLGLVMVHRKVKVILTVVI